jgi:hypothetical protein
MCSSLLINKTEHKNFGRRTTGLKMVPVFAGRLVLGFMSKIDKIKKTAE